MFILAWTFGWRAGSLKAFSVGDVNFETNTIQLRGETTKSGKPVRGRMTNEVKPIIKKYVKDKNDENLFFGRDGIRIVNYDKVWRKVTKQAHVPGLLFDDLCRTATHNVSRMGVSETVIMTTAGREAGSLFDRYNVVTEDDLDAVASAHNNHAV